MAVAPREKAKRSRSIRAVDIAMRGPQSMKKGSAFLPALAKKAPDGSVAHRHAERRRAVFEAVGFAGGVAQKDLATDGLPLTVSVAQADLL